MNKLCVYLHDNVKNLDILRTFFFLRRPVKPHGDSELALLRDYKIYA